MFIKYTLTASEAKVLAALGQSGAILPDLTVAARLTPTEIQIAVRGLAEKQLVRFIEGAYPIVQLTPGGKDISRLFEKGEVTILPDEYATANAGETEQPMSSEDRYQAAEAALTAEIERLSQ